ncbi:MAG: F0F1 ATP synthase subunit gamma [Rhodobacteraceae bacterium]|nr:MAG: F0F1 ATP synthase subunit gamma [Paracoccaceae bacterium]|tara:strand:+ start:1501 stop:2370 length:870 start_codon:yes stop_codon:yes gene_type:complete
MPNLKDLKNRIESVKSTRKITKAMQMVAAAKLRRAQESAEAGRPYAERMKSVINNLANGIIVSDDSPKLLTGRPAIKTYLLIVATSERGLCGGFNSSIVKMAKNKITELVSSGNSVKIYTIGKKGREQLTREFDQYFFNHFDLSNVKSLSYDVAVTISKDIIAGFNDEEYDSALLFFSQFQSVLVQNPTEQRLIPASFEETEAAESSYDYEPEQDEILEELLPQSITTQIFTALLENAASEQGARMSAMDNATRNAGDMIDKLTIKYNRSRQAAITNELIEIISGAEAL